MRHIARNCTLLLAIAASSLAGATPAQNVCVPAAIGVPSRSGPPHWLDWGLATPVDEALDDPRWLGATGHSFKLGAARAPLLSRALWTHIGTQDYLLMSFVVDLEGLLNSGAAAPRDLFLGFRRPATFAGAGGNEIGYIFQFHLTTGSSTTLVRPEHCSAFNTCDESAGTPKNFWRVFVDRGASGTCSGTTGHKYERFVDAIDASKPPITWMTAAAATDDAVRFWKLDASQAPLLQNRWAVQLRIPVAANDTSDLQAGIPPSSTFWYQGSAALTTTPPQLYANLGFWPRALTHQVCPASGIADFVVQPDLDTADNWSRLTRFSGSRPADCDKGLTIETSNVGSVFNAAPGTDFSVGTPGRVFKAGGVNTVVAQVQNLTAAEVKAPMVARFRLAGWGSAPWLTPTEHGVWKDMRGAEAGVCGTGLPPDCICQSGTPPTCPAPPEFKVPASGRAAFTFPWTIGSDATLGPSEYCKFGLKPPDVGATVGACVACDCSITPNQCDHTTDTGMKANVGSPAPCVSSGISHQCMLVELSAPNGNVDFVEQSAWNNMDFDQMSVVSREALIDARQLPKGKDQKEQDIYLLVMARNMPGAIADGSKSGALFVRDRALRQAETLARPYLEDIQRTNPQRAEEIIKGLGPRTLPPGALSVNATASSTIKEPDPADFRERIGRISRALDFMPPDDFNRVGGLLKMASARGVSSASLNEAAYSQIGPAEAAGVVPTLEIYPFYQPLGVGNAYLPMTAFTVFLSHEGQMTGMRWLIDGATKVGDNIYHLRIPVGFARRIQVRAEAIEPGDKFGPQNPRWPCGCCGGAKCGLVSNLGNTVPGLIAGVFVIGRRRRKRAPRADAAS